MPREPELIVGYDEKHFPSDAVCSACGEHMPWPEEGLTNSSEAILLFTGLFQIHLRHSHSDRLASGETDNFDWG
jgi:hypothetical protein